MTAADKIALGGLLLAVAGAIAGAVRLAYDFYRQRWGVKLHIDRHLNSPAYAAALSFPIGDRPAGVLRVAFLFDVVVNNTTSTPVVISAMGFNDGQSLLPPVGGLYRSATVRANEVTLQGKLDLPYQLGAHNALAATGLFQVLIPNDLGAALLPVCCPKVSVSKMKEWVVEVVEAIESVDVAAIGLEVTDANVRRMSIADPLLSTESSPARVAPRFGRLPVDAWLKAFEYSSSAGMPAPTTRVQSPAVFSVQFLGRSPLAFEFVHSGDPLWFLVPRR